MSITLNNVNDEIKKTLESLNDPSIDTTLKQYISEAQSSMKTRVEETKRNIEKYQYNGIIGNLSAKYSIDKYLILGIIATESNGNPTHAPSESGYYGCMQTDPNALVVSTAEFKAGSPQSQAQWGIETGCRMFKAKYECFPDCLWEAITAYNAGQGTVGNGLSSAGLTSPSKWKDGITAIAKQAASYWGTEKIREVTMYALNVMFAYTYFAGYTVSIKDLPSPDSGNVSDKNSSGGNPLSNSYNAPPSSNVELKSTPRHGKHADYVYKSPDKLYCEPVYPDYISVNKGIPEYAIGAIIASEPANKLQINGNMCYEATSKEAEYASLKAPAEKQKSTSIKLKGDKAVLTNHSSSGTTTVTAQQVSLEQLAHTIKEPSIGKPVNNNDPFPVDSKIEELELHTPRCKIDKIQTCPEAINVTKACIKLSMDVEKRIVRLENNMATILRYLARYAARVPMNCVYYGGQVPNGYEKYKCIRCLKDDRISDGQLMQFDQCLNCERYEPIIGQVYDILDDTAQNLSRVLDDCQMSYSNMNEYTKLSRSTMHQQKLSKGSLDKANINTRATDDKDFDWTQGQVIQWNTVPVEDQVPHINRIQNINGEELSNLSSCQTTATNAGSAFCSSGLSGLLEAKEEMDKVISGAIASQLVSANANKESH